jgi:nuclear protein localization family protein 4
MADRNAVRPGLMSLRSRKLHWTMDELMQIEAGYTFKIQRQPKAICQGVSLDRTMCNDFQQYVRQIGFGKTRRCAWLYGRYVEHLEKSKVDEETGPAVDSFGRPLKVRVRPAGYGGQKTTQVQVDCSYEPPQRCTTETMELLDDPNEELVQSVATSLGLIRVGFMYSHPGPREDGHHFSANEVIMCAENQLLAGDEDMQSPFVTVKVTLNENNESDFQAYQLSRQCLELVAEGALLYDPAEPRGCLIHDTFSCLVEAKEVSRVDNDYFLANVPIMDHSAPFLTEKNFETPHRFGGHEWNIQALGPYMKRTKKMPMLKRISDFNVLLLSSKVLDPQSMKAICSNVQKQEELEDGYVMILESLGM